MRADLNNHFKQPVRILKFLGQFENEGEKPVISININLALTKEYDFKHGRERHMFDVF